MPSVFGASSDQGAQPSPGHGNLPAGTHAQERSERRRRRRPLRLAVTVVTVLAVASAGVVLALNRLDGHTRSPRGAPPPPTARPGTSPLPRPTTLP
ncbi:hypothetical protein NKG05_23505 [Oerskovia sp. M15]